MWKPSGRWVMGGQMLQCTGGVNPVALGATPEQTRVMRSPSFGQGSLSGIHKGLFSCTWGDSALLTMADVSSCTRAGDGPCVFSFHGDPVRWALITYAHSFLLLDGEAEAGRGEQRPEPGPGRRGPDRLAPVFLWVLG